LNWLGFQDVDARDKRGHDESVLSTIRCNQERAMITEIAQIDVKPGMEAEFEAGVKNAAPVFRRAKGCRGLALARSIEKPSRYRLFVTWETVENHTVDFRGSPDFAEWRKLVGHCFAAPPDVEHVSEVVKGF
jgi:quinol monooxygenase YgiN